ncbi:MAG: 2-oxo acid dehydrogenase subunit E2 [Gammaproteobacteria bacterium]|nr:2-oxo acid dehydrogenase subunit E2 [Gammaproteobacteria bacterium]
MTALTEIRISDLEEGAPVDVVEILVAEGEHVEVDQVLATLETDKALVEFPSPHEGVVRKIHVQPGDQVVQGDVLLALEATEAAPRPEKPDNPETPAAPQAAFAETPAPSEPMPAAAEGSRQEYASPAMYRYARELGVSLERVQGSGRGLRILKEDIEAHVRTRMQSPQSAHGIQPPPASLPDFSEYGETEEAPLTRIQKLTAQNLLSAWQSIPHVTHFERADVTGLEACRAQLAEQAQSQGVRLTPPIFVIKALAAALAEFPRFNASFDAARECIVLKKYFHIGIAVDTPHGLLVPVLRDVDRKTVAEVAGEVADLGHRARERKLAPEEMGGASMTVTSLGHLGGQAFTPIINPPEVAILGLSRMIVRSAPGAGTQNFLPLSLSYDHRVINGAEAARFSLHIKAILEDIWKLVLG